jgi:secreted trypsin-like serine protease
LVLGGRPVSEKDYPWLVAHYYTNNGFICGGSLVSKRIVVTAAHCIWDKKSLLRRTELNSTYYLGKHQLSNLLETGSVKSKVQNFALHPSWDPQSDRYDADIAIAVLRETIVYTDRIIPICVWTGSVGHKDLIVKKGYIAGEYS